MTAVPLFDVDAPRARKTDDRASHEAARRTAFIQGKLRAQILDVFGRYRSLTKDGVCERLLETASDDGGREGRARMKPTMSLALLAQVDQSEAWLREWLAGFSAVEADVHDNPDTRRTIEMVAVDALAALSEVWERPVGERLDVLTARLLAWQRISQP